MNRIVRLRDNIKLHRFGFVVLLQRRWRESQLRLSRVVIRSSNISQTDLMTPNNILTHEREQTLLPSMPFDTQSDKIEAHFIQHLRVGFAPTSQQSKNQSVFKHYPVFYLLIGIAERVAKKCLSTFFESVGPGFIF